MNISSETATPTNDANSRRPLSTRARLIVATITIGWCVIIASLLLPKANLFQPQKPGDGYHIDTYGFNLSNLTVPRPLLAATGSAKNTIKSMINPQVLEIPAMEQLNSRLRKMHKGKFIVDTDRVIGVTINGKSRAYPIRFMSCWFEVINDTLANQPIAITYHGLCDSVAIFDRNVNGETLEFGVSGLLYNSNQLLYDRRENPKDESLWSQLAAKPIAGKAVDQKLKLKTLPMTVTTWGNWKQSHPDTTILRGLDDYFDVHYKKKPFARYWNEKVTIFPVEPKVPENSKFKPFDRVTNNNVHSFYFAWFAIHGETGQIQTVDN